MKIEPAMLFFDATHTSHTRAQTGIQRVCRSLHAALAGKSTVAAVCFDPHLDDWRKLTGAEQSVLNDRTARGGSSRGSRWSLVQKISGHARRLTDSRAPLPVADGLVCPEFFSSLVGARLPSLLRQISGPRVAIFHDAIGLKHPELTPPGTVERLPAYLHELRQFDGVAAVSEDSAASLLDFWRWLGVPKPPVVQAIPLGLDACDSQGTRLVGTVPHILCVGTIEGRKNHLALLDAAEMLWREGLEFKLELIGLARPDTGGAALARIETLRAAKRALVYHGSVSEEALHHAYARAAFTVYPSFMEGFGLPVLESLQHAKPCICSAHGAMGESARAGGVLTLASVDALSLAQGMRRLLQHPGERAALAQAAERRTFRTWRDFADDLTTWMATLRTS